MGRSVLPSRTVGRPAFTIARGLNIQKAPGLVLEEGGTTVAHLLGNCALAHFSLKGGGFKSHAWRLLCYCEVNIGVYANIHL